ncbi:XRE family transcriptional regulator [Enterocloster clostridioformis]|uniref:helix-turn-helix domain-containing protein n=1 Tax=Enterocloster clostridioformis TaxID=1531 RepID=UPI00080CAAB7|nr:helix-turn-helix transcriptional regulator [Enterocloster clostridioformis]ANU48017.1 transcriptional regulator [Lachnoclostridium sp. YL32]NDO32537.1 helix-turn-helix transcriptional regulator [Enterocloster clostridioformis]OXE69268.1 XRE family transcriptional regulator [Enterocloster clostridioformis]QQR03088.1 helix-turn-helix transcriptional regulator [Enterocloster clostridioformis]
MNVKIAVARRIHALCLDRNIAIKALANQCGVVPSTIYSMLNTKSKNLGIVSIQKICDGLEISIREFFDDPLFENLEPEIK